MICVSIKELSFNECLEVVKNEELVELRFDLMNVREEEIEKLCRQKAQIIATCRPKESNDTKRMNILKHSASCGATFVDIELESSDAFKQEVMSVARKNNTKIIISHHDYNKTPTKRELEQIMGWCFESHADIAKIVCHVSNESECSRILSLYDTQKELSQKIIAFGLGNKGKFTRIASLFLGAPFIYASLTKGNETAEGQLDKETLESLMGTLQRVGM